MWWLPARPAAWKVASLACGSALGPLGAASSSSFGAHSTVNSIGRGAADTLLRASAHCPFVNAPLRLIPAASRNLFPTSIRPPYGSDSGSAVTHTDPLLVESRGWSPVGPADWKTTSSVGAPCGSSA